MSIGTKISLCLCAAILLSPVTGAAQSTKPAPKATPKTQGSKPAAKPKALPAGEAKSASQTPQTTPKTTGAAAAARTEFALDAGAGVRIPVINQSGTGWLGRAGVSLVHTPAGKSMGFGAYAAINGNGSSKTLTVSQPPALPIEVKAEYSVFQLGLVAGGAVRWSLADDKHRVQLGAGAGTLWLKETEKVSGATYTSSTMRPMLEAVVRYGFALGPGYLTLDLLYDAVLASSSIAGSGDIGGLGIVAGYSYPF